MKHVKLFEQYINEKLPQILAGPKTKKFIETLNKEKIWKDEDWSYYDDYRNINGYVSSVDKAVKKLGGNDNEVIIVFRDALDFSFNDVVKLAKKLNLEYIENKDVINYSVIINALQ
tara:strand:- start:81215 stop:81562 length:348 start_codon:yes stop_codon:yes gene_type:complete